MSSLFNVPGNYVDNDGNIRQVEGAYSATPYFTNPPEKCMVLSNIT